MTFFKERVITYRSPKGETINLTTSQAAKFEDAGVWPRDSYGEEYCETGKGEHWGWTTWSDRDVQDRIEDEVKIR